MTKQCYARGSYDEGVKMQDKECDDTKIYSEESYK